MGRWNSFWCIRISENRTREGKEQRVTCLWKQTIHFRFHVHAKYPQRGIENKQVPHRAYSLLRNDIGYPQADGDIRHRPTSWVTRKVMVGRSGPSCLCLTTRRLRMLYKTLSAAVYGIDANIIQVEVDCSGIKCDQDHFHTVGLPDAAVRESRDRVRAALKNCGYDIPPTHITINLAPADIKKEGSGFDLPMALGIVGAYGRATSQADHG